MLVVCDAFVVGCFVFSVTIFVLYFVVDCGCCRMLFVFNAWICGFVIDPDVGFFG